jgi:5-oxoprolinase (ATP-hydrolysing) subunit A
MIDLNCDMGEGIGNDEAIMPFISSVNIACGYHAGDAETMWRTAESAVKNNVAIGAHPSFPDRENFGRTEMDLPLQEIYQIVIRQLVLLNDVASSFDVKLNHVKPHGALYNMSARDPMLAETIAQAVKDFDDQLILFGLSNSHSTAAAIKIGLVTMNEGFADRSYQDDGSLTSRTQPGALIEDEEQMKKQVLQMVNDHSVTSANGKKVPLTVDTICIHGDGASAIVFAKAIRDLLNKEN